MIRMTQQGADVLLPVKAVPNASRSRLMGQWDGHLKVSVAAPPEKGKANKAIVALLAKTLGIARNRVVLETALSNPQKVFRIGGMSVETVRAKVEPAAGDG